MEDIENHIVVERSLTPTGIERMYNAEGGAIYGLASHGKLGGGFKPRNSSTIEGLFVAGGSATLSPGKLAVVVHGGGRVLVSMGLNRSSNGLNPRWASIAR